MSGSGYRSLLILSPNNIVLVESGDQITLMLGGCLPKMINWILRVEQGYIIIPVSAGYENMKQPATNHSKPRNPEIP